MTGPYRFVRNPMISGVIFLLIAEACILRSRPHTVWAGVFAGLALATKASAMRMDFIFMVVGV